MKVFAIDPGPENSAVVCFDITNQRLVKRTIQHNLAIKEGCRLHGMDILPHDELDFDTRCHAIAIEKIASYGMPVGEEVFATCRWTGRFIEAWVGQNPINEKSVALITRGEVKMHLCHSMRANDANIRAALLDRFGPGKEKAIGTKKNPGPLYGIKKDLWAALAVAVTYADLNQQPGGE